MKVLIIHPLLSTHYKNQLYNQLNSSLMKLDIDLMVIQISPNEKSRKNIFKADLDNIQYPYHLLFNDFIEDISSFKLVIKLIIYINNYKPDVLNISGFYTFAHIFSIIYCKFKGIKVIISNDSTRLDNRPIFWKEWIKRFVIRLSDGFFCFGSLAVKYMEELGANDSQILASKCAVVDNDTIKKHYLLTLPNRELLKKELNLPTYNFIYVGRFIPLKNLHNLLQSFHRISEQYDEWGLVLLGDGNQKSELLHFIDEKRIRNITFIEGQPWFKVSEFLTLADVFVLPSYSEAWGLVVNEALICQMPVIVSDKCGCSADLVKIGKNGFIFDTYSTEDLYQKMKFFAENPDSIDAMGKESECIIENFTIDKCADDMVKGFMEVLK